MRINTTTTLSLVVCAFAGAALAQSDAPLVSARDAFRKAKERFYVAQSAAAAAAPKPAAPKPQASPAPKPKPQPAARPQHQEQMVQVVDRPGPLGLRYSLQRLKQDGSLEEVDAATTFRTGDKIRVHVESSDRGYLYVVNQGASGRWNLLFPRPDMPQGTNRIEPGHPRTTPEEGWFEFDANVGQEKLFLMLSRMPVAELENRIYQPSSTRPQAAPAGESKRLAVRAELDDTTIAHYRDVYSRDILFQKVSNTPTKAKPSPEADENAVYVVTQSTDPQARVVTDVTLLHQ